MVTLLGAFLRLYRIDQNWIWVSDTGDYVLDARAWLAGGKLLAHRWGFYKAQTTQEIFTDYEMHARSAFNAKPAHSFFRAVGMMLFGNSIGASNVAPAFFGIIGISLLFFFAHRLFGDARVSLAAAAFMAISPAHLTYSRGLKCEADTMVFALLSLWLYYEGAKRRSEPLPPHRWFWASGFAAGMAVACNGRLVDIPPLLMLVAVAEAICWRSSVLAVAASCARVLMAIAMVVVFWELPFHWALLAWHGAGSFALNNFSTFWESLNVQMHTGLGALSFSGVGDYFYFLFRYEGLVIFLALVGLVAIVRPRRIFESLIVAAWAVLGFLVFWAAPFKFFYLHSFALPAVFILAAFGFVHLIDVRPMTVRPVARNAAVGLVVVATFGWSIPLDWRIINQRSRLADAIRWIRQNRPDDPIVSTFWKPTVCEYDWARVSPPPWPMTIESLRLQYEKGTRLLLIDPQKFAYIVGSDHPVHTQPLPTAMGFVEAPFVAIELTTTPLATFTNVYDRTFFFVQASHWNNHLSKTRAFLKGVDPHVDSIIRIYDLGEAISNAEPALISLPPPQEN
jgi:4-amino-4-deoxy-L-arabinose transferase-like glycosyltransferase